MLFRAARAGPVSSRSGEVELFTCTSSLPHAQPSPQPQQRKMISQEEASEKLWKWRYKFRHLGKNPDKGLDDFSQASTVVDADLDEKKTDGDSAAKNGELGSSLAVKTLYEGPKSHPGFYDWVDYPPKQLSKSVAKAQSRVAIKVFKIKDTEKPAIMGRLPLRYHSIEVQNPSLIATLTEILKRQDVHLDTTESATFCHPFRELYFAYDDITAKYQALEKEGDNTVRPFVLLLLRLLDDMFAETRAKLRQLRERGLVPFKLAWTLFPKKTTVVSWACNCELLSKVEDASYTSTPSGATVLQIRGKVLTFNGHGFRWEDHKVNIPAYSGNKPITELAAYPLEFHDAKDDVVKRLTARGIKVLDLQGLTYVCYQGIAIHTDDSGPSKHNVDCRVLIDVVGYNKHHLTMGTRADPQAKEQLVVGEDPTATPESGTGQPVSEKANSLLRRLSDEAQARNKKAMLDLEAKERYLMYMMPLIEGYALKNKLWLTFFIDDIKPMAWNDEAYDHLVYDEQQKDLVMSFVENHGAAAAARRKVKGMQDVIAGKGEGLIMLLSGPPGTGKTLMAEAVADRTHRPLFYLQAEDLGINAALLGANIKKVFEMATEWDAVILLDEADVFMAERHPQDIARNELVSIFLRELEYFRGIIFLTTNLFSTIDSAFRSRVSLHLLFKPLTPDARTLVWRKFLARVPEAGDVSEDDFKELAAWELNGREIKTAVKMTRSWCEHKGYELSLDRLENGIRVTSPHASKTGSGTDTSLYE
ncbi:ATP-dependent zinc metalloprotease YME1L1 [Echria macrotheca]|uniref:ATP-dependent zinc metalloprotease YME1L1 n=1 Tax=Echria macrotheca TaxID=438768 RepID=A0AAJ0BNQ6_9PEZI|nr:ATP-dependent zinc metalloprotease YME1L1 [Echria macrotheca]